MSKAHEYKFLYMILAGLMLFLSSCVETEVSNIEPSFDFHSLLKIANIASGSSVTSVTVINNSTGVTEGEFPIAVGTENPAEGQAFMDIQSGSKRFILHGTGSVDGQLFIQTLDSERKYRVYIFNSDSGETSLLKSDLRYTWQQKGTAEGDSLFKPDSAFVGLLNFHTDAAVAFIEVMGPDTTVIDLHLAPIENGDHSTFMLAAPNNFTINLYSPDEELITTLSLSAAGAARYSAVLYGVRSEVAAKIFTDD
ncbi:MAG: hypothetical protein ACM34N_02225 [Ignavibacteria bacterium]